MPPLSAKERAQLPDSAFAYIDSRGRRRLPIHDAAHVRNALARFSQVAFEDEGARDRARSRLLRAAKKHGIMPIGFVSAQLQPQRKLPKGHVTFLLTDIEGSTELLGRLDDRYAAPARRCPPSGARRGAVRRWSRGVRPRGRRLRGLRTRPGGARGRAGDPAGDARRRLARRDRRAAANRPAPRASGAHRYRLRRPLGPRRRAHLLRGARRPDRDVLRRARGGRSSRSQTGSASGALAPGDSAACPSRSISSRWRRLTCSPTSRLRDRPPQPAHDERRLRDGPTISCAVGGLTNSSMSGTDVADLANRGELLAEEGVEHLAAAMDCGRGRCRHTRAAGSPPPNLVSDRTS